MLYTLLYEILFWKIIVFVHQTNPFDPTKRRESSGVSSMFRISSWHVRLPLFEDQIHWTPAEVRRNRSPIEPLTSSVLLLVQRPPMLCHRYLVRPSESPCLLIWYVRYITLEFGISGLIELATVFLRDLQSYEMLSDYQIFFNHKRWSKNC